MEGKDEKVLSPYAIFRIQVNALINVLVKKGIISTEELIKEYELLESEELQKPTN